MHTRAVVVKRDETGQKKFELLESLECPPVDKNCIAIKVKACGLSLTSSKVLENFNLVGKKEQPFGREISGVVTNIGSAVTRVTLGDEVAGLIPLDSTSPGCANFCVMSEYDVVRKPEKVDHIDAAGCIGDVIRAYTALHYQARVCGGETILVVNGASAFGVMAVQLAHVWGAKVLTTASSEEEIIYLESVQPPIANIIDVRKKKKSLVDICMDETGGLGVDCIIDSGDLLCTDELEGLGSPSVPMPSPSKHDIISCLAVAGRWVTSLSDLQLNPPDSQILYLKGASVNFLFEDSWTLSRGQQGRYLHILSDIMDKLSSSVIRPVIHHTVSLEDACDTLQHLSQHTVGKIVVRM